MTIKTPRINGRHARAYVAERQPFTNSNGQLYGVLVDPETYVVYSYGIHWPLFIWSDGVWYENEEKASRTTSKHRSYAHPHCETELRSCTWLRNFLAPSRNAA